jgi:polar amino acid transport system substrate-binding protein
MRVAFSILLTLCAACGGEAPVPVAEPRTDVPACTPVAPFQPTAAGTLTVVTSLPGPGFWEGSDADPSAVTSGFEWDVAQELRRAFCLDQLWVRNESFDAIVGGSVTGFDLALSQISITPERAQVVTFSRPYFESRQGVLVKSGRVVTKDDLPKLRWGVQAGTTAILLLDSLGWTSQRSIYPQLPDAYTALEAAQVDAVLIDTAINLGQAARSGGRFVVVGQLETNGGPDRYGALLPKGSPNLAAVDEVLARLEDSGRLRELATKDLSADPGNLPIWNSAPAASAPAAPADAGDPSSPTP